MHTKTNKKLRVAVIGGGSITGGEVCRLLLNHPMVGTILPTSNTQDNFERVHRNLQGSGLTFYKLEDIVKDQQKPDVVFFCTSSGEAMQHAPKLLDLGVTVIDLSGDFRFKSQADFENVYGMEHVAPDLLPMAICGISEYYRDSIKQAKLIANPGCYVIATVLGLAPLLKENLVLENSTIHICAVNGTSGAGSSVHKDIHHAFAHRGMLPYNLSGHRHRLEMEKRLEEVTGNQASLDLTTVHGNFARGIVILASISVKPEFHEIISRDYLCNLYNKAYASGANSEHFVKVNDFKSLNTKPNAKEYDIYPNLARVVGSNYCHIGMDYDKEKKIIKVISVIDNLVKGAAGSAIQNMNLAFGLDETSGLLAYGL